MSEHVLGVPSTVHNKSKAKSIILVVAAGLSLVSLMGCETIERETGFNKSTQEGAAGGAAFGGIIAAIAGANPAWIAASVILGGVAGGAIGNSLGKQDAERHARTNLGALDSLGEGQTESWHNEKTGNHGSTTVTRVVRNEDGHVCKSYREAIHTQVQDVTKEATACKNPGGSWHVTA